MWFFANALAVFMKRPQAAAQIGARTKLSHSIIGCQADTPERLLPSTGCDNLAKLHRTWGILC